MISMVACPRLVRLKIFQAFSVLRQNTIVCREVRARFVPRTQKHAIAIEKVILKCLF